MECVILGTQSGLPTADRNTVSVLCKIGVDHILFDCGEGTQRQLRKAKLSLSKITKVFVSHWHGDHTLGISGLLQSMGRLNYDTRVQIYGPKESKKRMQSFVKVTHNHHEVLYDVHEISKKLVVDTDTYYVEAYKLNHSIECYGYRIVEKDRRRMKLSKLKKLGIPEGPLYGKLQEGKDITFKGKKVKSDDVTTLIPGKKLGIIFDTGLGAGCKKVAQDVDVLICESTFAKNEEDLAIEYKHLSSEQAAHIAADAGAQKLVLFHFSQRYKDVTVLEKEAQAIFPETIAAYDLMKIRV